MSAKLEFYEAMKRYDSGLRVGPFELSMSGGELVGLCGPNGAGKSTLLRMAAGLLEIDEGSIAVCGAVAGSAAARAELSFISDEPALFWDLSVGDHVEFICGLHGVEPDGAVIDALDLRVYWDALPGTLSRGWRQRVSLALGLVRPFSVLLLDEPFGGLDPAVRSTLGGLLEGLAWQKRLVVLSTHNLEALPSSARVINIHDGKVVPEAIDD